MKKENNKMSGRDVFYRCLDQGIFLYLDQGKLAYKSLNGELSDLIRDEIRKYKAILMEFLEEISNKIDLALPGYNSKDKKLKVLPLSYSQKRLWFIDALEEGSNHYNESFALHFKGVLNLVNLQKTFQKIVDRHESLRTVFVEADDGEPYQVVREGVEIFIPKVNFFDCDAHKKNEAINQILSEEANTSFDLSRDLMIRAKVVILSNDESLLFVTMHHIASDGWSKGVLVKEVSAIYSAFVNREDSFLPELKIQYLDYTLWQRNYLKGVQLETHIDYWGKQLSDLPEVHSLPLDRPRPASQSFQGSVYRARLSLQLTNALRNFCYKYSATLFMGLHAALSVLLSRCSNEKDIVVGSPVANRQQDEVAPLIGLFINTLVLRSNLSGKPNFIELLKQSKKVTLGAYEHQQLPFEKLVDMLQPARSLSYSPLFQIMLSLQNNETTHLDMPGLSLDKVNADSNVAKYDLTLNILEVEAGLTIDWEYDVAIFDRLTIARFANNFEQLLYGLLATPELPVLSVPLLSSIDSEEQIKSWNAGQKKYTSRGSINSLFEKAADQNPRAVAVAFEDHQISYFELNSQANQMARYLQSCGVVQGDFVGICLYRSVEMVVAILAILKAGGTYIPIDPNYPEERISYILNDSGAEIILMSQKINEKFALNTGKVLLIDAIDDSQYSAKNLDEINIKPNSLAYIIYTSGSTGKPKGVKITHHCVDRLFQSTAEKFKFNKEDVWTLFHSFAFDFSVWEIWGALFYGAKLIIVPYHISRSPEDFYQFLKNNKVSVLNQTPSAFKQIITVDANTPECLDSLRYVIFGGEKLDFLSLKPWYNKYSESHPLLVNMYGITEITVHATYKAISLDDVDDGKSNIGLPLSDLSAYVLDEFNNPLPNGMVGELYIGGDGVAQGYLNREQLTSERFIINPFVDGTVLYKTGDLVRYLGNDSIEYFGRSDQQVKIRGFRIELSEIEKKILDLSFIDECIVLAKEINNDHKILVAYVVQSQNVNIDGTKIKILLSKVLPDYMLPSSIIMLDSIPLTNNGKVDSKQLLAIDHGLAESEKHVLPRTVIEQKLCSIWQSVLGVERVGIHDNFFSLGGDSILTIQIVKQSKQEGLSLTTRTLFEYQTVAELARVVRSQECEVDAPQEAVQGEQPLLPIQRAWLASQPVDPDHYNQSVLLIPPPSFDGTQLMPLCHALYERHDALRLRYQSTARGWVSQYEALNESMVESSIAIESLPAGEDWDAWLLACCESAQSGLQISQGPLMRLSYLTDGGDRHRLSIVIHHLAIDGVSWRILLNDLAEGWRQSSLNQPVVLGPKSSSYQQWSSALLGYVPQALQEREYWQGQCQQEAFRSDNELSTRPSYSSTRQYRLSLSEEETEALLSGCHRAYGTQINDVLLAGLSLGLQQWNVEGHVRVTLEGHGRESLFEALDIAETLGWFTTTYPVRLPVAGEGSALREVICGVKECLRGVPTKGIGYGVLRYLSEDDALATEVDDILFNYLGQFDQVVGDEDGFKPALEGDGHTIGDENRRYHRIGFNGQVIAGVLSFVVDYSSEEYRDETIASLGEGFKVGLQSVIAHCASASRWYTPSDFPTAQVSVEQLSDWQSCYEIDRLYPATAMQQGMLFHSLLSPEAYTTQVYFTLSGALNSDAFRQSWEAVVARHGILRTGFVGQAEALHQLVHKAVTLPWVEYDWRALSESEQEEQFAQHLQAEKRRGFDVESPPLMRLSLIRLSSSRYQLLWSHHHMLLDGWCLPLVFRDVMMIYAAECRGVSASLSPIQPYERYISWLQSQDEAKAKRYWQEALAGLSSPTPLMIDSLPSSGRQGGHRHRVHLSESDSRRLESLARESQTTLNTVVQYAWAYLLSCYSGEEEVVFGATVSGRPADLQGSDEMLGLFINSLPVRVCIDQEASIVEQLQGVHRHFQASTEYGYLPLSAIQSVAEIESGQGVGLFDSLVVFENYPLDALATVDSDTLGLGLESSGSDEQTNYALTLAAQMAGELTIDIGYRLETFSESTIERLGCHLCHVLLSLIQHGDGLVSSLSLISSEERHQLDQWNATTVPYPVDQCIHSLFEAQVARQPDADAVVYEGECLTYAALNTRANQLAHYLISQGVGPESLVGVCLDRSVEMVVSLLGILKAGGAYVPLDPAYPAERLAYMLSDSGVSQVVTTEAVVERTPVEASQALCLDAAEVQALLAVQPLDNPLRTEEGVHSNNLAYVIYTSGSTGQPKGVMVEHRQLVNFVHADLNTYSLQPGSRFFHCLSFSFDAGTGYLHEVLVSGATLYLSEAEGDLSEKMAEWKISHGAFPTALLSAQSVRPLPHLKVLIAGGEAFPRSLITDWSEHCRVFNVYGPTETTVTATAAEQLPNHWTSIGKPLDNVRVYVLDSHQQLCPQGVVGELYIGGDGVARGYLNKPELTSERFIADPFSESADARLYRSGDRVRWLSTGDLEYLGRMDDQVKLRGFRIELGEIESALLRCEGVNDAVVMVREDNGEPHLVAYVVPVSGAALSVATLKDSLKQSLPEYMVPSLYPVLAELPLTPNGKVDKKALPVPDKSELQVTYVAPRTETERVLCSIWQSVLGVERVGIHDNFFDLGGHSLSATKVAAQIRTQLNVEIPLQTLFEHQTLVGLAGSVSDQDNISSSLHDITPMRDRDGLQPASAAQQRLWFIDQLPEGSSHYHIPESLRLVGPLSVATLELALQTIVNRHESLRTIFVEGEDGELYQQVLKDPSFTLRVVDLRGKKEAPQLTRESLQREVFETAFDLGSDVLLRAMLLIEPASEHTLLLTLHHIACDGWSLALLADELSQLYRAYLEGRDNPLPALPVQYVDYTHWQRNWFKTDEYESQLNYWRDQLAGLPVVHNLPLDYARPHTQTYAGDLRSSEIPSDVVNQFRQVCRTHDATLFMGLNAVFSTLLSCYSGDSDIVIGTAVANREQSEISSLIGMFVNTLVIRNDLSKDLDFAGLLAQSRDTALAAYTHQQVPFEDLVMVLQPTRSLSHSPLFQVLLVVQNNDSASLSLTDVEAFPLPLDVNSAKYDISLTVIEGETGLSLLWEYNKDIFAASSIERLSNHFNRLLEQVIKSPGVPVCELPLLSESEQVALLSQGRGAAVPYPVDQCIHSLFEAQVARQPDADAVVYEGECLTYAALNTRANQLAHYLISQGVGPESLVGVCLDRSVEMVVSLLGILKAGGAYVPLDPAYPAERLAYMLSDSGVSQVVTTEAVVERTPVEASQALCLDAAEVQALLAVQPLDNPLRTEEGVHSNNLAYVIYTSGSTGQPKGVMNEHGALHNRLHWMQEAYQLDNNDRVLQKTPFSFDVSVWEFFWPLLNGACLIVARPEGHKDPAYLSAIIKEEAITTLHFVPSMLNAFVSAVDVSQLTSLQRVICSGEALGVDLQNRFLEQSSASLHNLYGPTEAAIDVTHWTCQPAWSSSHVPIGSPISNTQLYVLDSHQQLCPQGVVGELYIGGDGVARGYLNKPELTSERFIADPFSESADARLYRSGDRVRWLSTGDLEYLGRMDDQVKLRGFRIELGEIESALLRCEGVTDAVVMVREDSGEPHLVAYVVPVSGAALSVATLKDSLKQSLPEYMVPSLYPVLAELPLTPNGKVDKKALPVPDKRELQVTYVAPRTETERVLCSIWQSVLGVERVGIHDNFFDLGGHSLLAIRLLNHMNNRLLRNTSIDVFLQMPTIYEISKKEIDISKKDKTISSDSDLLVTLGDDSLPTIYCVPGAGLTSLSYYELGNFLQNDYCLKIIEPRGLYELVEPYSSMDMMVNSYVELVCNDSEKNIPVLLLGHSFGASVAFEMAKMLEMLGRQVKLILCDSQLYIKGEKNSKDNYFQKPLMENLTNDDLDVAGLNKSLFSNLDNIFNHQLKIFSSYMPSGCSNVETVLLLAKENRLTSGNLKYVYGKHKKYLTGKFICKQVDGDHFSMLRKHNVSSVSKNIRLFLQGHHQVDAFFS